MKTHIFKIQLLHDKRIQREIEVPEDFSLYRLAGAIVGAYGFDFDHAFGFFSKIAESGYYNSEKKYELFTDLEDEGIESTGAGSVKKTKVRDVWKTIGDKMLFLFDYGDNWLFVIELIGFGERDPKQKYPHLLKKMGNAPKQY